jgi:hypothetical protein
MQQFTKLFSKSTILFILTCLLLPSFIFAYTAQAEAHIEFFDIKGHWGESYINTLRDNCGLNGYEDETGKPTGQFGPDTVITRAELAKVLLQCKFGKNVELDEKSEYFPDVKPETWYVGFINKAKQLGWIKGYEDGTFRPDNSVNRAEALKMILLSTIDEALIEDSEIPFNDIGKNSWYRKFVAHAYKKNVINGYPDGTFGPEKFMTRAEVSKVVRLAFAEKLVNKNEQPHKDTKNKEQEAQQVIPAPIVISGGGGGGGGGGSPTAGVQPVIILVEFGSVTTGSEEAAGDNMPNVIISGGVLNQAATIDVVLLNSGTATAGTDFTFLSPNTLTIPAGDYTTIQTIPVSGLTIIDDSEVEGNETIGFILQNPLGVIIGDANSDGSITQSAIYNIINDDTAPISGGGQVGVDMDMCNNALIPVNAVYVSLLGDDSNNGSFSAPYRTIYGALVNQTADLTIVLRGGTYVEPNELRIRQPNITIRSMPGEWAVIDRSADLDNIGVYFYVGSDGGSLQCTEVIGGFYAVSTETRWDWGDPSNRAGASNLLIENNLLHGSGRDVVKIKPNSDFITIRRNEIYNSGLADTPGNCNAEGIDNVNGDNMLVQNNFIHDICSTGVYFKGGATAGIVENNIIENTGGGGIMVGFDTSPEFFDLNVNPGYYENIGGIVRNNLIRNTQWEGIGLYSSKDAQVYNNTIINAAGTYHSPIFFGISFQDWDDQAGRPANLNPSIWNNVTSQSSAFNVPMISIRTTHDLGGLSGLEGEANMSGNCYYQESGAARFEDSRTKIDLGGGWLINWVGNLSEWKILSGSDTESIEVNPDFDANFQANGLCAGKGYLFE